MSSEKIVLCPQCNELLSSVYSASMVKCMNCRAKFYLNELFEITEKPENYQGLVQETTHITDPDIIQRWHMGQVEDLSQEEIEQQIETLVEEKQQQEEQEEEEESCIRVKERQAEQVVVFEQREEKKMSAWEKNAKTIRILTRIVILVVIGLIAYWMYSTPQGQKVFDQIKTHGLDVWERGVEFFNDNLKQEPKVKGEPTPGGTLLD